MFYFQTNHLHFTAEFLGRVRLVGSVASLAGVGGYNFFLKVCIKLSPAGPVHTLLAFGICRKLNVPPLVCVPAWQGDQCPCTMI